MVCCSHILSNCLTLIFLSFAKDGRGGDRDDMEDEHKERELRAKLNAEFQNFVKRVEDIVSPPHIYILPSLPLYLQKHNNHRNLDWSLTFLIVIWVSMVCPGASAAS